MIKILSKYMKAIDWKILLSMNENMTFNVTLVPVPKVKDDALKEMSPIILKNITVEQMDQITSETLDAALTKVQSLVSNVADFEKATEEKEAKTKMAKDAKEAKKKLKEKNEKALAEQPTMFDNPPAASSRDSKEETPEEMLDRGKAEAKAEVELDL